MFARYLESEILKKIPSGKAILVTGPRQVGKTTLIKKLLERKDYLFLDCDDPTVRSVLSSINTEELKTLIGNHKYVFIDEAQRIPGIGLTLKIIVDQLNDVRLLVSGSSSFDLSNALNEPLTGRKWEYELLPVSWEELETSIGFLAAEQKLENCLLYGLYPDVLNHPGEEREILKELATSYLYRDILAYSGLKKPEVLDKLVQSLALQVGSEVNYTELALQVGVDKNTIAHYIDVLEKGYVVFRLSSFSRNLRNEIKKNKKIYFYDNGIRNMVIGNFANLDLRADKGLLWENFLVSERVKQNLYRNTFSKMYFWRTRQQQEVDFVEERDGQIHGWEFKWNARKNTRLPKTFTETYSAESSVIDRSNFRDFICMGR
ncbi:ATP-binding protein [Spirochaeta isovalerica]|uniref:ATPase (AAA+ superfamily) n=1 Tax=Spirochaeta isovalerica TaxID=150 RepID=A0A841RAK7_9SPIO|nr:ATP-binding protein [Spirochaeta isovalerica]MBB6480756.1 hypothetical protein [Spirochaeta isovalerica]